MRKNKRQKEESTKSLGEQVPGVVVEALPNTHFKVRFSDKTEKICYLAGKMRLYRIRVLVGDKVEVLLDTYGGKGRIMKRL